MLDNHPIVPLNQVRSKSRRISNRNTIILNLKKKDFEITMYSSLDQELVNMILSKVLS